jgi:neurofibromin 1
MLVQDDMCFALSLCRVCSSSDTEDVVTVLLPCFASRNKTMELLKAVIETEVENTGIYNSKLNQYIYVY